MRTLRWAIVLAALGAVAYLATAVDFGGRTLLERVLGSEQSSTSAPSAPASDPAVQGRAAPAGAKAPGPGQASDALTAEDRAGLTELIEQRLDKGAGASAPSADGGPPAKAP